ncbi:MAG: methylated-DNA--[protein]-cysteine S-methyltransferase [Bacillota bacterium]|nr:methylated-DNA--[protein]-cysteine S-methyltransferase [Bacillota bacterium]
MRDLAFENAVYAIVVRIPRGKVATYGQIAAMLGNPWAARRVGQAMRYAPDDPALACHRVVNSSGRMAPGDIFGGAAVQRQRLLDEGVIFKVNGCIDLARSRWMFD